MSENGRDSVALKPGRFWCIWPAQRLVPGGSRVAPLIGQLSNPSFQASASKMAEAEQASPSAAKIRHLCQCGCGHAAPAGRKFVNQQHYDRSKGLSEAESE